MGQAAIGVERAGGSPGWKRPWCRRRRGVRWQVAAPPGLPALGISLMVVAGLMAAGASQAGAQAHPAGISPGTWGHQAMAPGWSHSVAPVQEDARIWFPRGPDPVFRRGEPVRVHFQTDRDAHVAIAQVDSSGRLHLHFPSGPRDPQWIRGGQEHLLLLEGGRPWVVTEGPGVGYFFILSSDRPLDWSRLGHSRGAGWDLSGATARSYGDPNEAMDDLVWALLPDWQEAEFALAVAGYRVDR